MIAYFSDKTADAMGAAEHPSFARIASCGKWHFVKHSHDSASGVLAYWDKPVGVDLAKPKKCKDGLIYFGYTQEPTQDSLARENIPNSFPVTLRSGRVIDIPMAIAAPKILAFDGTDESKHATEFGSEAYRIWEMIEGKSYPSDLECRRLVYLAINQTYRVTEELLSQLGWITDVDVVPILLAISGRDPKSVPAVKNTSAQSVAG